MCSTKVVGGPLEQIGATGGTVGHFWSDILSIDLIPQGGRTLTGHSPNWPDTNCREKAITII